MLMHLCPHPRSTIAPRTSSRFCHNMHVKDTLLERHGDGQNQAPCIHAVSRMHRDLTPFAPEALIAMPDPVKEFQPYSKSGPSWDRYLLCCTHLVELEGRRFRGWLRLHKHQCPLLMEMPRQLCSHHGWVKGRWKFLRNVKLVFRILLLPAASCRKPMHHSGSVRKLFHLPYCSTIPENRAEIQLHPILHLPHLHIPHGERRPIHCWALSPVQQCFVIFNELLTHQSWAFRLPRTSLSWREGLRLEVLSLVRSHLAQIFSPQLFLE
mmetsp:Transcript_56074/g.114627  ORF Transcript_56074/g.114627 Transcript_56074/m.114627 type:complete len:266 (+) Transcript_56074:1870-2667(+)